MACILDFTLLTGNRRRSPRNMGSRQRLRSVSVHVSVLHVASSMSLGDSGSRLHRDSGTLVSGSPPIHPLRPSRSPEAGRAVVPQLAVACGRPRPAFGLLALPSGRAARCRSKPSAPVRSCAPSGSSTSCRRVVPKPSDLPSFLSSTVKSSLAGGSPASELSIASVSARSRHSIKASGPSGTPGVLRTTGTLVFHLGRCLYIIRCDGHTTGVRVARGCSMRVKRWRRRRARRRTKPTPPTSVR